MRMFSLKKTALLGAVCVTALVGQVSVAMASSTITHAPAAIERQSDNIINVADSKVITGAKNFIIGVTRRGIGFLSDEAMSDEQKRQEFEKLLGDSFDTKTIGRFSLGRYWRTATKAEQKEYLRLFDRMIVDIYAKRFGEYSGEEVDVRGAEPVGKRDTLVTSYIVPKNGPEVRVDWRVRYKDGRYKVVDVIVEGVSMAVTQRSDFASVIQRGGGQVEVLLAHLR